MFSKCYKLESIIQKFNTINVIHMDNLFEDCKALISIDISNFNIQKVSMLNNFFHNCQNLKYVNLPIIKNVTSTINMFNGCITLKSINLTYFNSQSLEKFEKMFFKCNGLEYLDISSFNINENNWKILEDIANKNTKIYVNENSLLVLKNKGFNNTYPK